MNVPAGITYDRTELVMTLPQNWPPMTELVTMADGPPEQYCWPFLVMKHLVRMTYLYDMWLCYGYTTRAYRTIYQTYPGSDFSGLFIEQLLSMPEEASTFVADEQTVHCQGLYALYPTELQCILESQRGGAHEMMHRFDDAGFHEGVFPGRRDLTE